MTFRNEIRPDVSFNAEAVVYTHTHTRRTYICYTPANCRYYNPSVRFKINNLFVYIETGTALCEPGSKTSVRNLKRGAIPMSVMRSGVFDYYVLLSFWTREVFTVIIYIYTFMVNVRLCYTIIIVIVLRPLRRTFTL